MGILKKVLLFLLALIILMGIGTIFLPSQSHVERSITINAPASNAYAQVINFKNWEKWSPWKKADPTMKLTYGANTSGKGASYSWVGEKSGEGTMSILDAIPNKEIKTKLDFKGMGTSYGNWKFEPSDNGTKVTWGFDSELSGLSKWFGLMMDGQVGGQFEEGLAAIKKLAESMPAAPAVQTQPAALPTATN